MIAGEQKVRRKQKKKEKIGMKIQNKNYYTRRYKMEIEGIRIDDTVDIRRE